MKKRILVDKNIVYVFEKIFGRNSKVKEIENALIERLFYYYVKQEDKSLTIGDKEEIKKLFEYLKEKGKLPLYIDNFLNENVAEMTMKNKQCEKEKNEFFLKVNDTKQKDTQEEYEESTDIENGFGL